MSTALPQTMPAGSEHWTADGWSRFAEAWNHPGRQLQVSTLTVLVTLIAAVGVTLGILWLWERRKAHHLRSSPLRVFHRIAGEVGLTLREQWLLVTIARRRRLPSPLVLILSPATLELHGVEYLHGIGPYRRRRATRRLERIHECLFGGETN